MIYLSLKTKALSSDGVSERQHQNIISIFGPLSVIAARCAMLARCGRICIFTENENEEKGREDQCYEAA